MDVHFFTGFPGFIASELIKGLIVKGKLRKLYVLVLESEFEKAEKSLHVIREELGEQFHFEIITGDITLENLGMQENILVKIREESLVMWHLAAIYDLAVKKEIAWKVNVKGTKMVCNFVRAHPAITHFLYFSTAYIAGIREGKILESELIRPSGFKNHYEETKFEAECHVEKLKSQASVTIIQPGIVRGHSKTGETKKFDGPYFFMNMIDKVKWLPVIPYVGKSDAYINVVPIDYIIEASIYFVNYEPALGRTIHLTDPSPHLVEHVYKAMVKELAGKEPKGRFPLSLAKNALTPKWLQRKLGVEVESLNYLTLNANFDTTNAEELLKDSYIQCADFIATIPAMSRFYKENKKRKKFHVNIR